MKDTNKYDKSRQLREEGYLQEVKLETIDNAKAHSICAMSEKGRNDTNAVKSRLLEDILVRDNMNEAFKKVKANKGSHGIDGITVNELLSYLKENGDQIRQDILKGSYKPQAVRRVEIPKEDGTKRLLGIPTVVDRVIQQAIAQVLTPIYEKKFLDNSYGFRPNRNCHQAIQRCKEIINSGYTYAVDIDLAKYFDTVNHDKLINLISRDIKDGRVISLIRKYLQSGVMIGGVFAETEKGTPQGGICKSSHIPPYAKKVFMQSKLTKVA